MKNAKATNESTADTTLQDPEMEKLVTEAERQLQQRAQVQMVDLIDANTRGVLVLFPYTPRTIEEGKTYPVMTGHLDTRRVKIPVSAFAKMTDEGRQFLSLSIGRKGQDHIGGAVFRDEEQDPSNGRWQLAPGKENERHGVICKSVPIEGTDKYEAVFTLRFYGKRRQGRAGVAYIKAQVYPERRPGDDAMDGCF